jgi:hypothetical protein
MIVWLPDVNAVVVKVATPLPLTATLEANVVAPSVNFTLPVGTPPLEVTVAVNVTDWPMPDGLGEEVAVVVVTPCTDCAAAVPLLFW